MGQNGTAVDVDFVANGDIVAEYSYVLETSPLANSAVPADNGRLDPGMVLDAAVLQQHTALETDTVTDDDVGANCDIGANAAVLANLCALVNHDVTAVDVGLVGGSKELGVLALQGREVQAGTGEEILGLSNVHPEALQVERVQTAVLADSGEGLLLDRCGAELNAAQNAVLLVELGELGEGVFAGNVGVEDEEGRIVFAEDGLSKLQRAGGAKGLGLDGERDLDVVLLLVLRSWVNWMFFASEAFGAY